MNKICILSDTTVLLFITSITGF